MRFSVPSEVYSIIGQLEMQRVIESEDANNHKRGTDVEIGDGRLILKRLSDGVRFSITVNDSDVLVATEL